MSDEESFVILGSSPTPSMEAYCATQQNDASVTHKSVMQSLTQTIPQNNSLNIQWRVIPCRVDKVENVNQTMNHHHVTVGSANDFAQKFLMGEIPVDSLKSSISKQFPSLCTSECSNEDICKLESLMNDHTRLKENLHKTNAVMHQHFKAINKFRNTVKELKEQQAFEIAKCNEEIASLKYEVRIKVDETSKLHMVLVERDELNQNLKAEIEKLNESIVSAERELHLKKNENENLQIALTERDEIIQKLKMDIQRIREEQDEKTKQFNINMGFAAGENKELVQELSAKDAIIKNMTSLIQKLESQTMSFEFVIDEKHESNPDSQNTNLLKSELSQDQQQILELSAQLTKSRQQNIELMVDVTNHLLTIKKLESQLSKKDHQLLSLEMIANENTQMTERDTNKIKELKDDLAIATNENVELREKEEELNAQINRLKAELSRVGNDLSNATEDMKKLQSEMLIQTENINRLSIQVGEKNLQINSLNTENVIMQSRDVSNARQMIEQNEKLAEIQNENDLLKQQLDVYKCDFELERQARQDIANEREEILSDLNLLQRRNQQLIKEVQARTNGMHYSPPRESNVRTSEEEPRERVAKFVCPVCSITSKSLMDLQLHVQSCLEN